MGGEGRPGKEGRNGTHKVDNYSLLLSCVNEAQPFSPFYLDEVGSFNGTSGPETAGATTDPWSLTRVTAPAVSVRRGGRGGWV